MQRMLIAFAALILMILACGAPPPPVPAGLPTFAATRPATTMPLTAAAIPFELDSIPAAAPFAPYTPNPVALNTPPPEFSTDLATLSNPEAYQALTLNQQQQLAEQGFVIVPAAFADPLAIYAQAGAAGRPVYVTTDLVLYAVHQLTTLAGQQTERDHLAPDLLALSEALLAETDRQAATAVDEAVGRAAIDNLALFGVGLRLQDPAASLPSEVAGRAGDDLTLIGRADGRYFSPLRGMEADYRVYAPAGAAIDDSQIRGYRQAAAWYAQSALPVGNPDPAVSRPAARQLLLLLNALETSQNLSRWDRVQATQTYLGGSDFSPSIFEATALAEAVYGQLPAPAALNNPEMLDQLIATWQATWSATPFRLLPLSTRPDTTIFPALVFDRVGPFLGDNNRPPATAQESNIGLLRGRPTGPDVAAVLGSATAMAYLQESGNAAYTGYEAQMAALQAEFTGRNETAWTRTRPDSMLHSLQPLVENNPAGRGLNSWYGGWAMTRHEPVWISRPVSTSPLPAPGGYVAPNPLFYARQAALVRQLTTGLDSRGLLDKGMGEKLLQLSALLDELQIIAEQELTGLPLTNAQLTATGRIGDRLARLLQVPGPAGALVPPPLPFVTDVYHNPQNGLVLQAALGEAWLLYAITPGPDGPQLSTGAIFSTYEYGLPETDKWTNQDWQQADDRGEPAGWLTGLTLDS